MHKHNYLLNMFFLLLEYYHMIINIPSIRLNVQKSELLP